MSDAITRLNAALEGRYRVERELGEGGMATVYLADDLRHERKVALKVLKPELAAVVGAERFLAEIKTTANLQHPHILPLFDSGEADTFLFYVMPFIEGETLRERIDRDKQLPVEEAVRIASAVANALHTAHEHGIVHRDIKPGNILMSREEPLVADFGIALAVGAAGGSRLTETGLSVGTPYYMSPEQATGDQSLGPASDTYALACVLYEMLTGDPPYMGNTAQAVLGKIIQGVPVSATAVRKSIPANVDAAIRKALEKLPADRFTGAHEFARALSDPSFRHGELEVSAASAVGRSKLLTYTGWGVAAVMTGLMVWGATRPTPSIPVRRFAAPFVPGQELTFIGVNGFALSPEGNLLAYRHLTDDGQVLMVRRWNDLQASPVRETNGATTPTVSPDGQQLAFVQGGVLKTLPLDGGPVTELTGEVQFPRWGLDGYVYATADSGAVRIPATGGPPETVSRLREGDQTHRVVDLLPGGEGALMRALLGEGVFEILAVDFRSGEVSPVAFGEWAEYTTSGHLVYLADGTLMAAPFDPGRMEITGPAVAMINGVVHFSVGTDGSLFYSVGVGGQILERQAVWVTRAGQVTPIDPNWTFDRGTDVNFGLSLSPDGTALALREFTPDGYDIWVKQLDTGPRTRLTLDGGHDRMPVWQPGQPNVTFLSDRGGNIDVWSKRADGTGAAEMLLDLEQTIATVFWSPDGEWLIARTGGVGGVTGGRDIYAFRPGSDSEAVPLMAGDFDEVGPEISPDGRWIAYTSRESGQYELYVRPFPDVNSARVQVSINGGFSPRWSHSGGELFFMDADQNMVSVDVDAGDTFRATPPELLFAIPNGISFFDIELPFDVTRDDQRFVMIGTVGAATDQDAGPASVLVTNFVEELKARVPN